MPSGITPLPWVARIAVQRLVLRDRQRLALPAFRRVERNDVVALLQRGHAGADIDDDARALVAEDRREQPFRIGAGAGEFVGVADAGRLDLDQHLAGFRPVEIDRLDDEGVAGLVGYRGASVHPAVSLFGSNRPDSGTIRHAGRTVPGPARSRTRSIASASRDEPIGARSEPEKGLERAPERGATARSTRRSGRSLNRNVASWRRWSRASHRH